MAEARLSTSLKHANSKTTALVSEWILSRMKSLYPLTKNSRTQRTAKRG